jgi:dihydrofolate reductase
MRVSLIAAVAANGVIGKDNDLIWTLRDDMAFFKRTTKGHHVIMGRKNWESIPERFRPLPGRPNVVLSRDTSYSANGAQTCASLEVALDVARAAGEEEAFIIGGAQIYGLALELGVVDTMYLTHVDKAFDGDTWFPDFAVAQWKSQPMFSHIADDRNEAAFSVHRYDRIPVETQG